MKRGLDGSLRVLACALFFGLPLASERALAEATRPMSPVDATRPREVPSLELAFLFENDNKLLGLWQLFGDDGLDVGRTHGLVVSAARYVRPTVRIELELGSEMFTAQLYRRGGDRLNLRPDGRRYASPSDGRNIYFNELSWLVGRARGVFRADPRFAWLLGAGAVVSNRAGVSPGATFFQKWFHDFLELFEPDTKQYRYLHSGGVRGGALFELGARALGRAFARQRFRLRGHAEAALLANTLRHGTHARAQARLALDLGRRRHYDLPLAELALGQDVRLYPGAVDVMVDTQVDLFFHARRMDVLVTFDGYYGDPHNAYYDYNFNNTTTTLGLGFRVP